MISVNASSRFQCTRYPVESQAKPAFRGNEEALASQPKSPAKLPDEFQKLQTRHAQEKVIHNIIQNWNQFTPSLAGFTAPSVKKAVDQMTHTLNEQARLAKIYTNGAQQGWNEYKKAHHISEADEQRMEAPKNKFLALG